MAEIMNDLVIYLSLFIAYFHHSSAIFFPLQASTSSSMWEAGEQNKYKAETVCRKMSIRSSLLSVLDNYVL